MAGEVSRVVKRKRVKLCATVDVPVIVQITFQDDSDRGWESQYTIDNTSQSGRDVHVATITEGGTDETGKKEGLKIERVDVLRVLDAAERGQETFFAPDSRTVKQPPDAPPYFITHEKTHIVRYLNNPDDGNWIDSELIDEFRFNDPNDRGRDTYIRLFNPPDNQDIDGITIGDPVDDGTGTGTMIPTITVSQDLADITDSSETEDSASNIDPPWRLDPFQNIVRVSPFDFLITFAQGFGSTPSSVDGFHGTAYASANGKDWVKINDVPVPDNVTITRTSPGYYVTQVPGGYPPGPPYPNVTSFGGPETWPPGSLYHVAMTLSFDSPQAFNDANNQAFTSNTGPIAAFTHASFADPGAVLLANITFTDTYISDNRQIGFGNCVWLSTSIAGPGGQPEQKTNIYKSIDGAQTWTQVFSHSGDTTSIGHVRVKADPNDPDSKPNSVYAGCISNTFTEDSSNYLVTSLDGKADVWAASSEKADLIVGGNINSVNGALFAFGHILKRSTDGVTWTDVGLPLIEEEGPSGEQEFLGGVAYGSKLENSDPENPTPLYVTVTNHMRSFVSEDGITWFRAGTMTAGDNRYLSTVSGAGVAASDDVVIAAFTPDQNALNPAIIRSDDGGNHWAVINLPITRPDTDGAGPCLVDAVLYAHSTFAAAGTVDFSHAFICTSKDGLTWEQVVDIPNGIYSCHVAGAAIGDVKMPPPASTGR